MSFEELEREIRQDLLIERWRRYRSGIITLVLSILVGFGGYRLYEYYRGQQEQNAAEMFYAATQALEQDSTAGREALRQVMQNSEALGYQSLAQLRLAAAYLDEGEHTAARRVLLDLADHAQTPKLLVASATLQAALIPGDDRVNQNLRNRLIPYLADDVPWRHIARNAALELALHANDYSGARKILKQGLADIATPDTARVRIEKLLTLLPE